MAEGKSDKDAMKKARQDAERAAEKTVSLIMTPGGDGRVHGKFVLTELHGGYCGKRTWTTLAATVNPGSDRISLAEPVAWNAGDEVVVASTGYDEDETERRTLVKLEDGGKTAVLDRALDNVHGGVAPITAEVFSLTRNIARRTSAEHTL